MRGPDRNLEIKSVEKCREGIRKIVNLIIRKFADAVTRHGFHTVCVSGHTTFPPHYHHRDHRETLAVWGKTPSLQLLVLTRVFVTLFIGQHLLYTATCGTSLVRVAATSCGHMFPPRTHDPVSLCAPLVC